MARDDVDGSADRDRRSPHRGWWRRFLFRLQIVAVVLAVLGASAVQAMYQPDGWVGLYADVLHKGVRGPYRGFPSPLAAEPPLRSARVVPTTESTPLVFGGLTVRLEGQRAEMRAIDLRTGKTYWRYRRKGFVVAGQWLDHQGGRLYTAWSPVGGDRETELERLDIRAGRVRWRADLRSVTTSADGTRGREPMTVTVQAGRGTVAVRTAHLVVGLSGAGGGRRWVTRLPPECSTFLDPGATAAEADTFVIAQTCTENSRQKAYLLGVNPATGADRWRLDLSRWSFGKDGWPGNALWTVGDGRHVIVGGSSGSSGSGGKALGFDAAEGRVATAELPVDPASTQVGNGVLVSRCTTGKRTHGWCGIDALTGERLWTRPEPRPYEGHPGLTVDRGRGYVLLYRRTTSGTDAYQLGAIDLRTGEWLGRLPLPPLMTNEPRGGQMKLVAIEDGVVVLGHETGATYHLVTGSSGTGS
jgi:hypothetical protein